MTLVGNTNYNYKKGYCQIMFGYLLESCVQISHVHSV